MRQFTEKWFSTMNTDNNRSSPSSRTVWQRRKSKREENNPRFSALMSGVCRSPSPDRRCRKNVQSKTGDIQKADKSRLWEERTHNEPKGVVQSEWFIHLGNERIRFRFLLSNESFANGMTLTSMQATLSQVGFQIYRY